jgi:hypothetical protein
VSDYVHLNPVRANLIQVEQKLSEYPWSSYVEYLKAPKVRPSWLRVDRVLGECGVPKDSPTGREQFAARMEARRGANEDEFKKLKRGWYLGDKTFREELLSQMHGKRGAEHFGEEIRESAQVQAERLVKQELKKLGWQEKELCLRKKGDVAKVRMAKLLREKTTMTLGWIAERLHMGTKTHLAHLLYWDGREKPKGKR